MNLICLSPKLEGEEKLPENAVIASELSPTLSEVIDEAIADALELLGINGADDLPPQVMVTHISNYVDDKLGTSTLPEVQMHENSLSLGALWGEMVVKAYGWQWQHLDFGAEGQGIYVVAPNKAYCCHPLYFLNKIMMGKNTGLDGNNDNTVVLLFNMLKDVRNHSDQLYQVLS